LSLPIKFAVSRSSMAMMNPPSNWICGAIQGSQRMFLLVAV
jgi:hypothetical protein